VIWLGVAAMSAAGAAGRFAVMAGLEGRLGRATTIPWGTALVNVGAAFALGLLTGASEGWVRLLGTGFLGSFSTFSTWMVEGVFLAGAGKAHELRVSALWLGGMLAAGVVAFGLGQVVSR
jgi:CrcB protein